MKSNLFPLTILTAVLLTFTGRPLFALTVPVAQDTSSGISGVITNVGGTATFLSVADNQTALIQFDLSNLDVVPASIQPSNITSAVLQLYIVSAKPPGALTLHLVTSPWSETFPSLEKPLPSIDPTVLATIPVSELPSKGFVSVDITASVVAALASGSNLSIAIETATHGAHLALGSKEGPAIGYPAQLDIETTTPGPPDGLTIGTVTSGTTPIVTLTGSTPNQILNITLAQGPPGVQGEQGIQGIQGIQGLQGQPGPADSLTIGAVTSGTAPGVTINGTAPNQTLNFTLVPGAPGSPGTTGSTGSPGAADNLTIGTVTGGTAVAVTIAGTSPNQTLNFAIPNGQLSGANTAIGSQALSQPIVSSTSGDHNTAVGYQALTADTFGADNVAIGYWALTSNTTGYQNTATGSGYALGSNTSGWQNVATGWGALTMNNIGSANSAFGFEAALMNTTGFLNTALGYQALTSNTTGWRNIAIGPFAGSNLTSGSNNIDIGDYPPAGLTADDVAGEQNTIRIGSKITQTATYIAGIDGQQTNNDNTSTVIIDTTGRLGTIQSSRRYKQDIADMGDASAPLLRLRPVTFRYKQPYSDGTKPIQFGLIAEEVAQAFPALAVYDAKGQPETVKYQLLAPLLLNEFLKEHKRVEAQAQTDAALARQLAAQEKTDAAQAQTIAAQQKQIQSLTASLAKVSEQIDAVAQHLEGRDYLPAAHRTVSPPGE